MCNKKYKNDKKKYNKHSRMRTLVKYNKLFARNGSKKERRKNRDCIVIILQINQLDTSHDTAVVDFSQDQQGRLVFVRTYVAAT